jgi:hypothetical protein
MISFYTSTAIIRLRNDGTSPAEVLTKFKPPLRDWLTQEGATSHQLKGD